MNATALALCKKPIVGVAMWLSSMCVTNQALQNTYINLSKNAVVLDQAIDIPMDETYSLMLLFRSVEKNDSSNPGRTFYSYFCAYSSEKVESWKSPSQKLALSVEIVTLDGKPYRHKIFQPRCNRNPGDPNDIELGAVEMKRGKYRMLISNLTPVLIDREGKVQIILKGSGAGFP
jgi:hypothetical protein